MTACDRHPTRTILSPDPPPGVRTPYERELPPPSPLLDLLLSGDGSERALDGFVVHQAMHSIGCGEPDLGRSMHKDTPSEVVGHADVQDTRLAREDVDE